MATTLVAPQPDGLSEVLNFGGQDSIVDASVLDIVGKALELETTDNDRVASPTGEKFVSNASPPLSADSDDANPEPVVEEEAPQDQVGRPDVVETDKEVVAKDVPLDDEARYSSLLAQKYRHMEPKTYTYTVSLVWDPEFESPVPVDPPSASVDVQASSPIDQTLSPVLAPAVSSVIPEEAIMEQIDALVEDIPVPVHVDENSASTPVVEAETPSLIAVEQPVSLEEVHVLPKEPDTDAEQAILQQDTPTTETITPVPEEAILLSIHDSPVEEAAVPVTVEESLEAAADPLLENQLQEIIPVAQAAVESAEVVENVTNDSPAESEERFAGSQDIISPAVAGTQGSPDEGVTLQDPEEVDTAVNEPVVEVSITQEDDFTVSHDLQNSVADEESPLETGIEATAGSEVSQVVGNDSEDVAPEAPLVIQEAEPVDDLPSVENAPDSVTEEDVPVAVTQESLAEIPVEPVTTQEPEVDTTQAEVVEVCPLVKEEAEPQDDPSTADGASETVVEVVLPGAASEEGLAETPAESTTPAVQEVVLVTQVEPQADPVENDSVGVAVEAPLVIEDEEPAVAGNAPESVEDDVKPFIEESMADTPVVVDNLAESISAPDQEVASVLEDDTEAGIEQTEVLEETSTDVAEVPLVIEKTELTDEVSVVENASEPLIEETPLQTTVEESSVETITAETSEDTDVELVSAEENQVPASAVTEASESLVTAENAFPPVETLVIEQVPDELLPEPSSEEVVEEIAQSSTVFEGPEPTLELAVVEDDTVPVEDVTPDVVEEVTEGPEPTLESAVAEDDTVPVEDATPDVVEEVTEGPEPTLESAVAEDDTVPVEDVTPDVVEEVTEGPEPTLESAVVEDDTVPVEDVTPDVVEEVTEGPEPTLESAVVEDDTVPVEDATPDVVEEVTPLVNEFGVDTSVTDIISLEATSGVQESSTQEDPASVPAEEAEVADHIPTSSLEPAGEVPTIDDASELAIQATNTEQAGDTILGVVVLKPLRNPPLQLLGTKSNTLLLQWNFSPKAVRFKPLKKMLNKRPQVSSPANLADAVLHPATADDTLPPIENSADVDEAAPPVPVENAAESTDEVSDVAVYAEDVTSIPAAESPSEARVAETLEDDLHTKPSIADIVIPDESFQASENSFTSAEAEQPLLTPASQIERPKSPWTPSYSVTSQGPGLTAEEDISDNEISDATDVQEVPVVSVTPGEESGDTISDALVSEGERPKSPWTPSYSVSVQGSPMQPAAELESSEIPEENVDDVTVVDSEAPADVSVTQEGITSADVVVAAVTSSSTETFEAFNDTAQPESAEDTQPLDSLQANESVDVSKSDTDIEIEDVVPETFNDTVQPEHIEDSDIVNPPSATQNADEPAYVVGAEGDIKSTESVELDTSDVVAPEESTATSEIPSVGVIEEELNAIGATEISTDEDVAKEINIEALASLDKPEFLDAPQVERPWTPSYSVTQQGPGTPEPSSESAVENDSVEKSILADPTASEEMESEIIEPFAPKAIRASTAGINESQFLNASQETTKEIERPWTPSYSVLQQGPGTPLVEQADLLEPITVADPADVTSSSREHSLVAESSPSLWTPSYSVTNQGTPSPKPHTLEIESDYKLEPLASTSDSTPFPAAVDDDAQSVVTSLDTINDTPTARARLESTTSSRFFPGGWFAKPQPEGRTSTDNALGEFTPSKPQTETQQTSPDEPAPITADSETSGDDSDEEDEDEAKAKKGTDYLPRNFFDFFTTLNAFLVSFYIAFEDRMYFSALQA
ncbi:hypothetical protein BDZ89DRAFT_1033706 [Hymenopellis radicata]|nr:hypothetical protein BDZ89DRAFT_1033706 [Hymenopellis radicata]